MRRKLLLPLMAALALGACDSATGNRDARLTILLTDAPGDIEEAWVRIDDIYLQGSAQGEGDPAGRVHLLANRTDWIDLLTLSGGRTAELVDGHPVPPGTYGQLRFVVCEAWLRTRDGEVYASPGAELPAGVSANGTLHMPSACQSGFKVTMPDGALRLENQSTVMLVDFDVSQTFGHQAGHSGRWVMRPVAHAIRVEMSGSIVGTVALAEEVAIPACGGGENDITAFVPRAAAGEAVLSGTTSADGGFVITPVGAGTWDLGYADEITFTDGDVLRFEASVTPASVEVTSGGEAMAEYVVTAATCEAGGDDE